MYIQREKQRGRTLTHDRTYPDFGLHVQVRQECAKKIADEGRFVVCSRVECHQSHPPDVLEIIIRKFNDTKSSFIAIYSGVKWKYKS